MVEHVFCAFLGEPPREDFIPYVADFYLQLEDVQWTIVVGRGQRHVRRLGAQPRLLAQRRRLRAPLVQRHRQRRRSPDDGQGGGAARGVPAASSAPTKGQPRSTSACCELVLDVPARSERQGVGGASLAPTRLARLARPDLRRAAYEAPDRDPRSGPAASSRPIDSRIMPRVTPAAASCLVGPARTATSGSAGCTGSRRRRGWSAR